MIFIVNHNLPITVVVFIRRLMTECISIVATCSWSRSSWTMSISSHHVVDPLCYSLARLFSWTWTNTNIHETTTKAKRIIILEQVIKAERSSIVSMVWKMTCKVVFEMGPMIHITKNIIFKLFKEIIEVKVEIAGACSFPEVESSVAAIIVVLTFLWIWQYFVSCKRRLGI